MQCCCSSLLQKDKVACLIRASQNHPRPCALTATTLRGQPAPFPASSSARGTSIMISLSVAAL